MQIQVSLTVDIRKEKFESEGKAKIDKKQGQESAATAMLTVLKLIGIIATGLE